MTIGGNLDYGGQAAQSARFLGALAVDTVGSQSFDISSLIGPQDQALLVYWVATAPFTGLPCGVICQTNAPPIFFSGHTQLADGGQAVMPFQGAVMLYPVNIGGTIIVDNIGPGPVHIVGTLFVSAIVGPPYTLPITRRPYIGQGLGVSVAATAAATTTILPTPSAGTYYRLKFITLSSIAAPAAANRINLRGTVTHVTFMNIVVTAVANYFFSTPLDWETDEGVEFVNPIASAIPTTIAYELWQA